jgi:hypothetical protein
MDFVVALLVVLGPLPAMQSSGAPGSPEPGTAQPDIVLVLTDDVTEALAVASPDGRASSTGLPQLHQCRPALLP